MQNLDKTIWEEFEKEQTKLKKEIRGKAKIQNSGEPEGDWLKRIVEKISVSQLASESGIDKCPFCNYDIYFNDSRGWFICSSQRWNKVKCFSGNIVDLQHFIDTGSLT